LTVISMAVVLLGGTALLVQHGRATAYAQPNHQCPSVSTLNGFGHGDSLRISTRDASCAEALGVVRAMVSGVGVTFSGDPNNAGSFRWKLYGLPGWTCHGDGSGFPGHGAGGVCTKGSATVEWYHA
jgi:hypothetical protein